jgi:hypothetical protein
MTLILAATYREGIMFCYDKAITSGRKIVRYVDKVEPIGDSLAFGFSGDDIPWIFGLSRSLIGLTEPISLSSTLNKELSPVEARNNFVMGLMQDNLPKLFVSLTFEGVTLRECNSAGIGSGFYLDIKEILEGHNPRMEQQEVRDLLEFAYDISLGITNANQDVGPIAGFGLSILGPQGYQILETN